MERSAAGKGVVRFEKRGSRTVATETYSRSPLKFLSPGNAGHSAWVYSSNFGGGFIGGDAIDVDVEVMPESFGVLLTQASTKVYGSTEECKQTLHARVKKNAVFCSLPDPVVCFARSKFRQHQRIDLEEGSSLILVDALHCGREHSGERWAFDSYVNEIHLYREGKRTLLESQFIHPLMGEVSKRNFRFNAMAFIVLSGPHFEKNAEEIGDLIQSRPINAGEPFICSVSRFRDGILVRTAAVEMESLAEATRELLYFLPEALGDDPWARKW
ncbi:MAG: urease accessory protein UreD [Bacteriovoracaceae bacterium]